MDKDTWIEEKIKKLIDEGKSRDEAVAIAHSMWEEKYGEKSMSATYKLPILPASPCDAMQGKKITKEMIDGALSYNANFRPSYVYLNPKSAHDKEEGNRETLAQILKTGIENIDGKPHVVAEVAPNRKYKGERFEELAAPDGTHPGRSVDLWPKSWIPGCEKEFYLEGIALCGAQKPATVNLPAIYYSTQYNGGVLTFSINTGANASLENTTMAENDQKVDFAAMQKQLDDLSTKVDKQSDEIKTLSAERDHYKTESENLSTGYKELKNKSDLQDVNALLDSQEYRGKFKSDERDTIIEMALSLKDDVIAFASGKTRYQAYMESIKNRPVAVNLSVIAGGVPNQIASDSTPQTQLQAIEQFAAENKIDIQTIEGYNKADEGARMKHPQLFSVEQGVR